MELSKIEQLLEKYEQAETSLQEEQMLKRYFAQADIPQHLQPYQAMFGYFATSEAETFEKAIPIQKQKRSTWKWLSVAAAVALMVSVYTFSSTELSNKEKQEAQLALQQTKEAFKLLSMNLNKGSNLVVTGLQEFDNATSKVFK